MSNGKANNVLSCCCDVTRLVRIERATSYYRKAEDAEPELCRLLRGSHTHLHPLQACSILQWQPPEGALATAQAEMQTFPRTAGRSAGTLLGNHAGHMCQTDYFPGGATRRGSQMVPHRG